jgi:transcriptional regulator with XRE-family HTH domain
MAEKITPTSRAISDVLTGAYTKKRITQDEIAEKAGMSQVTVQKKLRGRSPISATDLVVLSRAIGVDPTSVLSEALVDLTLAEKLASEGVHSISEHRRKKKPSEMSEEELDAFEGERAANTDTEIGHDEPESP